MVVRAVPHTAARRPSRPLSPAAPSRVRDRHVGRAVGVYAAVVMGMWTQHGGLTALTHGPVAAARAVAQLSGLAAASLGLAGLILVARPRAVERRYGLDRMLNWHRVFGESMAVLVAVHTVAAITAWRVDGDWSTAVADLTGDEPYMAAATVGAAIIGVVTITSLRPFRRRLAYETWWFLHLTAYVGLALSFAHQIGTGTDFATHDIARTAWVGLHLAVLAAVLWGRWGRLVVSVARPLRVRRIRDAGGGVHEVILHGRRLQRLRASPGQFFFLRPLTRDGWWRCNPFSLSAAPTTDELRFSIKACGDATRAITSLPVGARVAVDGPYGTCTPEVADDRRLLFVVGGVGVAPARAMLQDLPIGSRPIVLYRARARTDLVHVEELVSLADRRGGDVLVLVGPSSMFAGHDPFDARELRAAVPDVADRVAVLCGPNGMLMAARSGLRGAGVPDDRIHFERPWW